MLLITIAAILGIVTVSLSDYYSNAPIYPRGNVAYAALVARLKKRATFPVYFPTFPKSERRARYLEMIENVPYKYVVEVSQHRNCLANFNAPNCEAGEIEGHATHDATTPLLSGKRISLKDGTTAYWAIHECAYIGCLYSGLTFEREGHFYVVALANGSLDDVRAVANAIQKI